jgi:hypothetical protein
MTHNYIREMNSGVPEKSKTTRKYFSAFCYRDYVAIRGITLMPNIRVGL